MWSSAVLSQPSPLLPPLVLGTCREKVDACQEIELVGAALQGLLLDFHLWSDAGVASQALLLEGVSSVVRHGVGVS